MNTPEKAVLCSLMIAILLSNAVVMTGFPVASGQTASQDQQGVSIRTSADDHNGRFFGEAVVQVVVTDTNADKDNDDALALRINVDGDGTIASTTFTIPNTNPGSQRFEFYLVHAASQYDDGVSATGTALDTLNRDGFDNPADGFDGIGAPIIRFGTDSGTGVELDTGSDLYQEVQVEIQYSGVEFTLSYRETFGHIGLDRDQYGSDSILYLTVSDQDANLNPTQRDLFNLSEIDLDILFEISGGSFVDGVMFEETGDNSAAFEGRFVLTVAGDSPSETPSEITIPSSASSSLSLSLRDMVNYNDLGDDENDSNSSDSTSIAIDNRDGVLDDPIALTFGGELQLTLRDNDQNRDSQNDETLQDVVSVRIGNGDSDNDGLFDVGESDEESIDMEETADDSGVFVVDGTNNEIKITFLPVGAIPVPQNGVLELRKSDIDLDITVSYRDTLDDDSSSSITSSFRNQIVTVAGTIDLPESSGLNDDFSLSISDPDLNDNPRTRDSYVFSFSGSSGTFPLRRGGASLVEMATLELEIAGRPPVFARPINYTLVETDINTGLFVAKLDMRTILARSGIDADDGDRFRMTYNDLMARTSRESSATLTIVRSSTGVDFSRTVIPIPPVDDPSDLAPESSVGGLVGTGVVTTLVVTDVGKNTQPSSENAIAFAFRNDPGTPRPAFSIRVDGSRISETIDTMAKYNGTDTAGALGNTGAFLKDILPELPRLTETGRSTGIFEDELVFVNDGKLDRDSWDNLKLVLTYYNDANEDESAGVSFAGHEGVLTTDTSSVRAGDDITITVQDEDLNLDDSEIEAFRSSINANGIFLVAIEPEDNNMETRVVNSKIFRESGPDTGIFTATFLVGSDIPVTEDEDSGDDVEINQATIIEISYNDEIDSTGGSGDEIELVIPVVTNTGVIQILGDGAVGPGTLLTVLIVDNDLNMNPRGTNKFEGDNDGDGIVVFRTDRGDAGRASPDLEETGPNTGVFRFSLQLVPIQGGDEGEPTRVEGGSESRLGVLPGDLLAIRYADENDGAGNRAVVSEVLDIESWDPEFSQDKGSYEENERATITILDSDANKSPDSADSVRGIRVYSDSDRVGRTYSALETDKNSGAFKVTFSMTTGVQSGAISAHNGDEVTLVYEDEFPGDYAERIEYTDNTEKKFFHIIIVGESATGTGSTSPSVPKMKDTTGNELTGTAAGRQVILSINVQNNNARLQPFVAIVEVRSSSGVSESIEWQTGNLNPGGSAEIGISWMPQSAGDYQVRTFVISAFEAPKVLSPTVTSEVNVVA
jgi:hypothetical protein